jgi:hypothetical protein
MSTSEAPLAGNRPGFSRVLNAGPLATMMTYNKISARLRRHQGGAAGGLAINTRSWGPPFSATGSTYLPSVSRNGSRSVSTLTRDPRDLSAPARRLRAGASGRGSFQARG